MRIESVLEPLLPPLCATDSGIKPDIADGPPVFRVLAGLFDSDEPRALAWDGNTGDALSALAVCNRIAPGFAISGHGHLEFARIVIGAPAVFQLNPTKAFALAHVDHEPFAALLWLTGAPEGVDVAVDGIIGTAAIFVMPLPLCI